MGQKTHPIAFRLGMVHSWKSKWFHERKYADYLLQDIEIRKLIKNKLKEAGVARVDVERSEKETRINIFSSRPGIIIGRGGTGIEELREFLKKHIKTPTELRINIEEIRNPSANAELVGQNIAEQLEKRVSFRRAMKQALERTMSAPEVEGVKIMASGRLNGAEMSRREWLSRGRMPLHTLRANIDFATVTAKTTYGTLGIKVWIYKGEVFENQMDQTNTKKTEPRRPSRRPERAPRNERKRTSQKPSAKVK